MKQTPAVHDGVPLFALHTCPHPPQFSTAVFRFASQPVATCPSQSPNPALQAIPHTPPLHDGAPPVWLHAVVQLPQ